MDGEKKKELQYLIKCTGLKGKINLDLVYKSKVLFDPDVPKLGVGMIVEFRYQKTEKSKVELWKEVIIAQSCKIIYFWKNFFWLHATNSNFEIDDEEELYDLKDAVIADHLQQIKDAKKAKEAGEPNKGKRARAVKRRASEDTKDDEKVGTKSISCFDSSYFFLFFFLIYFFSFFLIFHISGKFEEKRS